MLKSNIHRLRTFKKNIILTLICLIILINIKTSGSAVQVIPGWYGVEEWEIEVCSKWGGAEEAQDSYSTEGGPVILSQTTLSLQGKKISYSIEDEPTLYEASWYLETINEDIDFSISLINPNGTNKRIKEGTATKTDPANGYYVDYHKSNYNSIKMMYGGKSLEIPIIEVGE